MAPFGGSSLPWQGTNDLKDLFTDVEVKPQGSQHQASKGGPFQSDALEVDQEVGSPRGCQKVPIKKRTSWSVVGYWVSSLYVA